MLEENNIIIRDYKEIANIFNDFFVNIIERSTGKTGATQATLDWYSELMSPHTRRDF